jgi:two-component system chemotaxis response regulator CheY
MTELADKRRTTFSVLIIEDDQDDAFLLKRALTTAASEIGVALVIKHSRNGLDALGSVVQSDLRSRLPHIIIVDLNMPVMDGGRFLRLLRSEMALVDVPTVVLTTSTEKPVHDEALNSGANAVFAKPNSQGELVAIARKMLSIAALDPSDRSSRRATG